MLPTVIVACAAGAPIKAATQASTANEISPLPHRPDGIRWAMAHQERFPSRIEPMLAKPGDVPESDSEEWAYEVKWDGIRALGYARRGKWSMLSRRQEDVTVRYPELEGIAEALADHAAVLDGEVVALDAEEGRPRFQLIQSRMGLTSPAAVKAKMKRQPVDYVIFDLLHLDGESIRELPYLRAPRAARGARPRRSALADSRPPARRRCRPARGRAPPGTRGDRLQARRQSLPTRQAHRRVDQDQGLEAPGVRDRRLYPRRGQPREAGRVGPGRLLRQATLGAPQGRRSQRLHFAGGVGSGLKESDLQFLTKELRKRERPDSPFDVGAPTGPKARFAVWCEPELFCEVSWTEWTNQETLRQPAFKGMRDDKDPREVVKEF